MKILKYILIGLALIVLLVAGFLAYLGVFSSLKPYEAKLGPFIIVYESFTGPYAQSGPVFARVYETAKAAGIKTTRGLGIYYDDPAKVAASRLRSDCGVVVETRDLGKINALKDKLKVKRIAKRPGVVAVFPIRNALSYMIGPMKAYPALANYARAKGYKIAGSYELYDEPQGKIFFVLEIEK